MIIVSKVIAVIMFVLWAFFFVCMLMVPLVIKSVDKEDRILFGVVLLISLVLGYSLIIGGIQLWQI